MIYNILLIVQILVALGIIGLVLIQHGKGADAGAAFGGGSSGTVFGSAGAGSFLSRATAILAAVFFANSLALAWIVSHSTGEAGSLVDSVSPTPTTKVEVPVSDVPGGGAVPQQAAPVSDVPGGATTSTPEQAAPTASDVPTSDAPKSEPATNSSVPTEAAPVAPASTKTEVIKEQPVTKSVEAATELLSATETESDVKKAVASPVSAPVINKPETPTVTEKPVEGDVPE